MSGWEFRLRGPVEARFDGRLVHLAGRVDERVLADGNEIRVGDTHLRFTESDRSPGPRGDRE